MFAVKLFSVLVALTINASPAEPPTHYNKTTYKKMHTGLRLVHFKQIHKAYKEKVKGKFTELELKSQTDFSIEVTRPQDLDLFDTYTKRIPASIFEPEKPLECGSPQNALFIDYPADSKGRVKSVLYSYEYFICAGEGIISANRLLEKYIEKYGNYEKKDFDRNQHIYTNVKKIYEVRVKPVTKKNGMAGLVITVSDSKIFLEVYSHWRKLVRNLENRAKEKF